jgi:hypothetical protein
MIFMDNLHISNESQLNLSPLRLLNDLPKSRTHVLTYLSTLALLEKLPIAQPLKNVAAFYGTRRFITVLTKALHWSLF